MYPSVSYLKEEKRATIDSCLEMLKFSMGHTIVSFQDKYYEYSVDSDPEMRGLAIGGFDSAWMADIVASFCFDQTAEMFSDTKYHGIYRDDGINIFEGSREIADLDSWFLEFQNKINDILDSDGLQFTMAIWSAGSESRKINDRLDFIGNDVFLYLDAGLFWNDKGNIAFQVHKKPSYQTKYVSVKSHHYPKHKASIPYGIEIRLASLTSRTT